MRAGLKRRRSVIGALQVSNRKYHFWTRVTKFAAVLAVLASPGQVFAQMCPACYSNAAAQTPGLLQALKTGILVMMFPSLLMFIGIFIVVFRRRNSFNEESDLEINFDLIQTQLRQLQNPLTPGPSVAAATEGRIRSI